jgi:hypothetical protein
MENFCNTPNKASKSIGNIGKKKEFMTGMDLILLLTLGQIILALIDFMIFLSLK